MEIALKQRGGYIHIDADKARLEIPGSKSVPATETQNDCQKITQELRKLAIAGKRNILEEGTFKGERAFSSMAERRSKDGYKTEVVGVATHPEQSRFNVHERRERLREAGELPRDVPEKYHDEAYREYSKNMEQDTASLARVRVNDRHGQTLYDSLDRSRSQCASVPEALQEGRTLSGEQRVKLGQDWSELQKQCEAKQLPAQVMERIQEGKSHFDAFTKAEKAQAEKILSKPCSLERQR